jgi:hypothetical protein
MNAPTPEMLAPLALAEQVAAAMGPGWTAGQRTYRQDDTAEIVNEHGDTVFMVIMGRGVYPRANERGKVKFRASSDHELRDHYRWATEWPETMVSADRGPDAMARAVLRKIVPTLVENNRIGRENRTRYEADARRTQSLALRMAEALGDERALARIRQDEPTDRYKIGSDVIGPQAEATVTGLDVDLSMRDVPADLAERFLREIKAWRDADTGS